MFRANIYSVEPLTPAPREAINDGLGIVAAYMGETVTSNEFLVRLPSNDRGEVNPYRVGLGNLDPMVELHVMAVPMDRCVSDRVGLSTIGRGWAFVDTSSDSDQVMRNVSAHEVSHSLGFVLPSAEQSDPTSQFHCVDETCTMHKAVTVDVGQIEIQTEQEIETRIALARSGILRRTHPVITTELIPVFTVIDQYDFCLPCKRDLREHGERKLNELRISRLTNRKVIGQTASKQ